MQGEKQGEEENRVKKTGDSSCSLLSHFWSTSRSPFSTFYIPFQSSGSQESNASNGARFGVETKELQPLQADHSKVLRNQAFVARISQHFCTPAMFFYRACPPVSTRNCFIASGTTLMQNMYYLNGLEVTPSVAYVIITNFMYYLNGPEATPSVAYVIIRNFRYYLNALKATPSVAYVIIRNFRYYLNALKVTPTVPYVIIRNFGITLMVFKYYLNVPQHDIVMFS
ncbi:hypothetical protein AAG906_020387 [Vitis piasezkii]